MEEYKRFLCMAGSNSDMGQECHGVSVTVSRSARSGLPGYRGGSSGEGDGG